MRLLCLMKYAAAMALLVQAAVSPGCVQVESSAGGGGGGGASAPPADTNGGGWGQGAESDTAVAGYDASGAEADSGGGDDACNGAGCGCSVFLSNEGCSNGLSCVAYCGGGGSGPCGPMGTCAEPCAEIGNDCGDGTVCAAKKGGGTACMSAAQKFYHNVCADLAGNYEKLRGDADCSAYVPTTGVSVPTQLYTDNEGIAEACNNTATSDAEYVGCIHGAPNLPAEEACTACVALEADCVRKCKEVEGCAPHQFCVDIVDTCWLHPILLKSSSFQ